MKIKYMIIKMEQQISNDDIEGFKILVHDWLSIDDKIKQLKEAEKKLNEEKKKLNEPIMEFMSKNNIEDCNTSSGKLKYVISEVKKPINRQYLIDKLAVFFKNTQKSEEITSFLFENRETEQKVNLRRSIIKGISIK
jgi:hypothetical protein